MHAPDEAPFTLITPVKLAEYKTPERVTQPQSLTADTLTNNAPAIKPLAPVIAAVQMSGVTHLHNARETVIEPLVQKEIMHHHEETLLQLPDRVTSATAKNSEPLDNTQHPTSNLQLNDPTWLQQLRKTMNNAWMAEQAKAEPQPVIKVTIGRIDVRAVTQPQAAAKTSSQPKPAMSLEDFLKNKNGNPA